MLFFREGRSDVNALRDAVNGWGLHPLHELGLRDLDLLLVALTVLGSDGALLLCDAPVELECSLGVLGEGVDCRDLLFGGASTDDLDEGGCDLGGFKA